LWRKHPEGWTEREARRWAPWNDKPLVPGWAFAMRLEGPRAEAAVPARQARRRFQAWCQWVRPAAEALTSGLLAPRRQAAARVERHREGMLAHWQCGLDEGFSGRAQPFVFSDPAPGARRSLHRVSDRDVINAPATEAEPAHCGARRG